jgi:integrase
LAIIVQIIIDLRSLGVDGCCMAEQRSTAQLSLIGVQAPARQGADQYDHLAAALASQASAAKSIEALKSDLRSWESFAGETGRPPGLPVSEADAVAWLAWQHGRGLALKTVRRRAASLARVHVLLQHESPIGEAAKLTIRGIARQHRCAGTTVPNRKRALTAEILATAIATGDLDSQSRALLLTGLMTGLRRSELAALRWSMFRESANGVTIELWGRKQSEGGDVVALRRIGGPLCPVGALESLRSQGSGEGLVFARSGWSIARLVKRAARLAGEDAARFSAHSLRAGFATMASEGGANVASIQAQTGHRSAAVVSIYVRHAHADSNPAVLAVGRRLASAGVS